MSQRTRDRVLSKLHACRGKSADWIAGMLELSPSTVRKALRELQADHCARCETIYPGRGAMGRYRAWRATPKGAEECQG